MGRVYDAMRRSSEAQPAADAGTAGDLDVLVAESFRAEDPAPADPAAETVLMPLPATDAAVEPQISAVEVDAVAVAGEPAAAPEPAPKSEAQSLFDRVDASLSRKIVIDESIMPVSREQYRRLAAGLHHAQQANGIKVVMISSAVAAEGKTLTAMNLALTLSESYQQSVLLIDGDLRRPSLHRIFKVDDPFGLVGVLRNGTDRKATLHRLSSHLSLLAAGKPTSDPMAGLTSPRMRGLIETAKEAFDWVIIDTPPVGLLTDAHLLSAMVDASLVVVKAGVTPYVLVERAIEALGRDRTLGVVLNRATTNADTSGYGYYDYYYGGKATN